MNFSVYGYFTFPIVFKQVLFLEKWELKNFHTNQVLPVLMAYASKNNLCPLYPTKQVYNVKPQADSLFSLFKY